MTKRRFSDGEREWLRKAWRADMDLVKIADELGRTPRAIRTELSRMGIRRREWICSK
jgi:IS30 family transposase